MEREDTKWKHVRLIMASAEIHQGYEYKETISIQTWMVDVFFFFFFSLFKLLATYLGNNTPRTNLFYAKTQRPIITYLLWR